MLNIWTRIGCATKACWGEILDPLVRRWKIYIVFVEFVVFQSFWRTTILRCVLACDGFFESGRALSTPSSHHRLCGTRFLVCVLWERLCGSWAMVLSTHVRSMYDASALVIIWGWAISGSPDLRCSFSGRMTRRSRVPLNTAHKVLTFVLLRSYMEAYMFNNDPHNWVIYPSGQHQVDEPTYLTASVVRVANTQFFALEESPKAWQYDHADSFELCMTELTVNIVRIYCGALGTASRVSRVREQVNINSGCLSLSIEFLRAGQPTQPIIRILQFDVSENSFTT